MNNKQKIILISVSSVLVGTYLSIFIYQRIQRAKADKSVLPADDALKILDSKKPVEEPDFSEDDTIPKLNDDSVDSTDVIYNYNLDDTITIDGTDLTPL